MSAFAWLASGGAVALLLFVLWWSSRAETSLYRLLGVRRSGVIWMYSIEAVLLALLPFQIAVAIATLFSQPMDSIVAGALLRDDIRSVALIVVTPLIGSLVTTLRSPDSVLKDQ